MKVYETSVRSLVLGAVDGVDGTVFAYGGELDVVPALSHSLIPFELWEDQELC